MLLGVFRTVSCSVRSSLSSLLARPQRQGQGLGQVLGVVSRGMANHRHKKMIKLAKGYRGRANRCFTVAKQRVEKARQYAFVGRKLRKRRFRTLWIQRLNASTRMYGLSYSRFVQALNNCGPSPGESDIRLNRKVLADLAITEPLTFRSVLEIIKDDAESKEKNSAQM